MYQVSLLLLLLLQV